MQAVTYVDVGQGEGKISCCSIHDSRIMADYFLSNISNIFRLSVEMTNLLLPIQLISIFQIWPHRRFINKLEYTHTTNNNNIQIEDFNWIISSISNYNNLAFSILTLSGSGLFLWILLLKLTVLFQIFIKVLSNHIFLESHIVT